MAMKRVLQPLLVNRYSAAMIGSLWLLAVVSCEAPDGRPEGELKQRPHQTEINETVLATRWNNADRLNRRTCPSTNCGVVGQLFFREGVKVFEERKEWVRTTKYYDASCVNGVSEYVDEGNARCVESNGIVGGVFAEWVSSEYLSAKQPPDPAANAEGFEILIAGSDDYQHHKDAFVVAAKKLIDDGVCSEDDFRGNGGWLKSVTTYRKEPVYFTYCGGYTISNRIYLDVSSGRIFR